MSELRGYYRIDVIDHDPSGPPSRSFVRNVHEGRKLGDESNFQSYYTAYLEQRDTHSLYNFSFVFTQLTCAPIQDTPC